MIIKQLVEDFKGPFRCLGENTEKYITFSICIFKKTDANEKPIAHQIKLIDSYLILLIKGDFTSSIDKCFEKLNFYLSNLIYYYMLKGEWKIQLSMQVSFISPTNGKTDIMHSKSDNIESMTGCSTNDILNMFIETFKQ